MPNPKHVGSIEISSPEVRKLFQVLTGEEWPNISEAELWDHALVWAFVADLLEKDLTPEMVAATPGSHTGRFLAHLLPEPVNTAPARRRRLA